MNVTVIGAAGRIGRLTVEEARNAGHKVTTADRPSSHMPVDLTGELFDADYIETAIRKADAVVATIGPSLDTTKELTGKTPIGDGIANIMDIMGHLKIRRLILLGTPSIVAKNDDRNAKLSVMANTMASRNMPNGYIDMKKIEGLVSESNLNWTVVRYLDPNAENDGGGYTATLDLNEAKLSVSRHNIARFIINETLNDRYIREMPLVFNK